MIIRIRLSERDAVCNQLLGLLRQRYYASGVSQATLAKYYGISLPRLNQLITGRSSIDGLSMRTMFKLFDKLELDMSLDIDDSKRLRNFNSDIEPKLPEYDLTEADVYKKFHRVLVNRLIMAGHKLSKLAAEFNVSAVQISNYINSVTPLTGMSLYIAMRLFPLTVMNFDNELKKGM